MSDLIKDGKLSDSNDCPNSSLKPVRQQIPMRRATLSEGLTISRILPHPERRMVGAWCFFDHFGPVDLQKIGLNIGPHPHIGLQTFTWPLEGEILHRDSLGYEQVIRPGEINLMTAGKGITHSEESISKNRLEGVQLWIALPDSVRFMNPEFAHYTDLPVEEQGGFRLTLLAGDLFNQSAPAKVYSPLIGLDLNALSEAKMQLPMNPKFEYGVLVLSGQLFIENEAQGSDSFVYLGCGRTTLSISASKGTRAILIGGEPFAEEILIWWNFVARSPEEISKATDDWQNHRHFGEVKSYPGPRLNAPTFLKDKTKSK
ncbi:pirin family protein [Legionella massiliensis]|uniref:pirin family protein n=1 Tax=Legionella massiliensis TaxID=1034943 RepID=UPI000694FCA5|nr:pirin family protein [Legionella massiliensis]